MLVSVSCQRPTFSLSPTAGHGPTPAPAAAPGPGEVQEGCYGYIDVLYGEETNNFEAKLHLAILFYPLKGQGWKSRQYKY